MESELDIPLVQFGVTVSREVPSSAECENRSSSEFYKEKSTQETWVLGLEGGSSLPPPMEAAGRWAQDVHAPSASAGLGLPAAG